MFQVRDLMGGVIAAASSESSNQLESVSVQRPRSAQRRERKRIRDRSAPKVNQLESRQPSRAARIGHRLEYGTAAARRGSGCDRYEPAKRLGMAPVPPARAGRREEA